MRRVIAIGCAVGLVLGVALDLFAQRLHNSVEINACYKIRNGKLRLADQGGFCGRNELPIKWPATCECLP